MPHCQSGRGPEGGGWAHRGWGPEPHRGEVQTLFQPFLPAPCPRARRRGSAPPPAFLRDPPLLPPTMPPSRAVGSTHPPWGGTRRPAPRPVVLRWAGSARGAKSRREAGGRLPAPGGHGGSWVRPWWPSLSLVRGRLGFSVVGLGLYGAVRRVGISVTGRAPRNPAQTSPPWPLGQRGRCPTSVSLLPGTQQEVMQTTGTAELLHLETLGVKWGVRPKGEVGTGGGRGPAGGCPSRDCAKRALLRGGEARAQPRGSVLTVAWRSSPFSLQPSPTPYRAGRRGLGPFGLVFVCLTRFIAPCFADYYN